MYCMNCGKQLREDERFCSNCGVKVEAQVNSNQEVPVQKPHNQWNLTPDLNVPWEGMENTQNEPPRYGAIKGPGIGTTNQPYADIVPHNSGENDQQSPLAQGLDAMGENKMPYFGAIGCLLGGLLLIGKEMFKVTYEVFYTNSYAVSMFENNDTLRMLFVVAYLAAAGAMLLPLLTNREWKKEHFLLGKWVPVVSMGWFLFVLLHALSEVNEILQEAGEWAYYLMDAADVKTAFTAEAWMLLAVSVGAIVLVNKVCGILVPNQEEEEQPEEKMEFFIDNV